MTSGVPLIAVVGATGTGKSGLSLDIARRLADLGTTAEVINADAMQLYRGMNIGTAKLSQAQRGGIQHHMIDCLDVTEEATVSWYQPAARNVIAEIVARGNVPILVGGSGLYVSSVLFDFEFPAHDDDVRAALEQEVHDKGVGVLAARLRALAPETAARVDPRNTRRVVRALEVIAISGSGAELGRLAPQVAPPAPAWSKTHTLVCHTDRDDLVRRLDQRVIDMWAEGLLDEVAALVPLGLDQGVTARRAIGYAQALGQMRSEFTQDQAIAETQALTRRYARRQVSWFKRYESSTVIDVVAPESHTFVSDLVQRVVSDLSP
jgi:tRNA dimethylallyltransferase